MKGDINLLKFEQEDNRKELIGSGILVFAGILLFFFVLAYIVKNVELKDINGRNRHLTQSKAELSKRLSQVAADYKLLEHDADIKKKGDEEVVSLLELVNMRILWSHALAGIGDVVPPDVWLTGVSSKSMGKEGNGGEKRIIVSGFAENTDSITGFMGRLEAMDEFRGVSVSFIRRRSAAVENEEIFYDYEITMNAAMDKLTREVSCENTPPGRQIKENG